MLTRLVVCLVSLVLIGACSTTRPVTVTDPQILTSQIKTGDTVEIERKDGTVVKFEVTGVSSAGLRGGAVFVRAGDIAQLKVIEGTHPAMVVFLVLLAGTAVWMLLDSDDVCGDWPAQPCEDGL